jgi:hypothetical protein
MTAHVDDYRGRETRQTEGEACCARKFIDARDRTENVNVQATRDGCDDLV